MDRVVARNVVVLACAASAGVHAALVPEHLEESAVLGAGFAVAAVLALAAALAFAGDAVRGSAAAGLTVLLLAGLIVAYVISRTVGLPVGDEGVESLDAIGVATQSAQAIGLCGALLLVRQPEERTHSNATAHP